MELMTGRTVYHFHTRTKTGRVPELNAETPGPWVELAPSDAADLGVKDGDLVHVESRRGSVDATVRCTGNRPGTLFIPFHYGDPGAAANELTPTRWDPVSKQQLIRAVEQCARETESQQRWLMTRMKAAAPQALLVAD
jgi:anaerobic selenocysteine-containing dehydrogenase